MFTVGAIGAGHMGMVILDAMVEAGLAERSDILVYDISPERRKLAEAKKFASAESENAVYSQCKYLLLAVRPQECEAVLERLKICDVQNKPVVLSIVSGTGSAFIRRYIGDETGVVNIVPNITLAVGLGATVMSRTPDVPDALFNPVKEVFALMGEVVEAEEKLLTDIIPANGCAPGYAFYFIDAVAQAVAARGIDYDLAVRLAAKSFAGAAEMVLAGEQKPEALLRQVCSAGGLTIQAIEHYKEKNVAALIAEGVDKSIIRGYELAR